MFISNMLGLYILCQTDHAMGIFFERLIFSSFKNKTYFRSCNLQNDCNIHA